MRIEEDKGFIDGLPGDAVKVISFVGLLPRQARELSSVRAHRLDLAFARKCLELINETENDGIRQALRRSAATHYAKCFAQAKSTNERKPLHPNKVLEPGEARKIHRYFTSHRDKHLIHDVNAWLQVPAGAVIAAPGKGFNVEEVICDTFEGNSLNQPNYGNLWRLIERALAWIEPESERLCDEIKAELEKIPRETLVAQPDLTYRAPEADDIHEPSRQQSHAASEPRTVATRTSRRAGRSAWLTIKAMKGYHTTGQCRLDPIRASPATVTRNLRGSIQITLICAHACEHREVRFAKQNGRSRATVATSHCHHK